MNQYRTERLSLKGNLNCSVMKKFSIVALLLILFATNSKTQGLYSKKNLEKASVEDLSLYLTKAQKQRKTGGIITIIGSSALLVGGVLLATDRETALYPARDIAQDKVLK
jgi:hypothetical protein